MERDTLKNLLIAMTVFLAVMWVAPMLFGPPATPPRPAAVDTEEIVPPQTTPRPAGEPPVPDSGSDPSALAFEVDEAPEVVELSMGADPVESEEFDPSSEPYRMRLSLSNIGASVSYATLTDHAEELGSPRRYRLLAAVDRGDRVFRSLAVERAVVDGVPVRLVDRRWHAHPIENETWTSPGGEQQDGEVARFSITLKTAGEPAVRIWREYRLPRQPAASMRHDLFANVRVENLSGQGREVLLSYFGGVGVRETDPRLQDRYVDYGIDPKEGLVEGTRLRDADVSKQAGQAISLYKPEMLAAGNLLAWAATANTYFSCTVAPVARANAGRPAEYIASATALDLDGIPETGDDVTVRFVTKAETVPPAADLGFPAEVYLGEKEPRGFKTVPVYEQRNYYFQISQGFGWCTFNWLVDLMIWLLDGMFYVVRDYGVAIIILVLIVRTLLHPVTKKGQVNMVRMQKKMQELAPKIEEIKKKYANDKARMQQEMMKLNLNPGAQLLTCLPMFIQMPIWVALYLSLSNNISMRHEPLHFTWVRDLTAPDALIPFSTPLQLPLIGQIDGFNLLPVLLAIAMYINQKLMPKPEPSPNMTEQQKAQQEMMQKMGPIMSVMFFFLFYKAPSGLNLYIMASFAFGTLEQHRIRKHIKEQEAAGTLLQPKQRPAEGAAPVARSGKPGFFEKLQQMAEDARKDQLNPSAKKKKRK